MIKKFLCLFTLLLLLVGCQANRKYNILDTQGYNYAILKLPNGEIIEGNVECWADFEDGDQLEVKVNGVIYLTSSFNCVLLYKE